MILNPLEAHKFKCTWTLTLHTSVNFKTSRDSLQRLVTGHENARSRPRRHPASFGDLEVEVWGMKCRRRTGGEVFARSGKENPGGSTKSNTGLQRLGSGGTVISMLSDAIQLASRLVAVTFFRTAWTFGVKYTYSTLLHAAVSSSRTLADICTRVTHTSIFIVFFPGKPTSSCWHFHSEPRWQRVPEQRAHCAAQIVTFSLRLQLDEIFPANVILRYRRKCKLLFNRKRIIESVPWRLNKKKNWVSSPADFTAFQFLTRTTRIRQTYHVYTARNRRRPVARQEDQKNIKIHIFNYACDKFYVICSINFWLIHLKDNVISLSSPISELICRHF